MSLKAVHLIFVGALTSLALGCCAWKARDYASPAGTTLDLVLSAAALFAAVLVVGYGRYFLKKLKTVGYL